MNNYKNIKLLVLDVDGVLTDGTLLIGSNGVEYKGFNTQDGMGISLAKKCGIKVAIITGRFSESVKLRAKELQIDYVYQGISNKHAVLNQLMTELNLLPINVGYMGDDINDLVVKDLISVFFAPVNAVEIVKEHANVITKRNGGNGAVREVIDMILTERDDYQKVIANYFINIDAIKQ